MTKDKDLALLGSEASGQTEALRHDDHSDDFTPEQIAELRADFERWLKNRPVTRMREYIESALFLLSQIEAHLKKCDHCWYPYRDAVGALRKALAVDGGKGE